MFKLQKNKKDHRFFCGNKYEKYSIKKLKVGAASVLVGTGFLFGYNLDQVEANEVKTESVTNQIPDGSSNLPDKVENASTTNIEETNKTNEEPKRNEAIAAEKVASNDTVAKSDQNKDLVTKDSAQQANTAKEEVAKTASPQSVDNKNEAPKSATSESHEGKQEVTNASVNQSNGNKEARETSAKTEETPAVNVSVLREKLAGLESQVERIHGNQNQLSHIQNAEKLLAEAKKFLESAATSQKEVDSKAKEISSLTIILKSIKAEEVTKENKNKDSRNGKKMEEGTGFRTGETSTSTTTGVGADVVDATETPAVTRPPYTERRVAEGLAKQIAWLDFSDLNSWSNVDIQNGNVYLKEGSIYEKEIMPNYRIKLKVKSLKPFQATEIYRKRMEANNATADEKATFNPNATNGLILRTDNNPVRITAQAQDQWSEIRDNGINTNGRKTSIIADRLGSNIGIQFEISGTYKGNVVRPAVVMTDAESANPGENIVFTTNGSGWQQIIDLKKNYTDDHRYRPLNYYTTDYKRTPDASWGNDVYNTQAILDAGAGNKIVPKFFTNPDQETGGLGTGVFGPGVTAGKYSVPVVMTKNATEVGMYVFSSGAQAAMIGVAPIDEGDAPTTYGEATHTMNTRDGLTGAVVKQPYLGSERPDADTGTPKNWHGDDDTDTADEGINQLLPDSLKGSEGNIIKANISEAGYYTLNIQAHTGGAERAFVRSWLDFNGNGKFDEEEASDIAEITEDGDVTLHFRSKTSRDAESLLQAGTRVRIATSRDEIENPTGLAFSGEVEDFNAKITHPPKGDKQTTIGNATVGNNVEKQSATVHFTPKGKNIYEKDDVDALIDTNVAPIYINNKTKKPITLSEENTYTVIGQGTYKFTPNGKDVDVEFTPAKGFVGKAHGITIRRQDTNKTTTDWGTSDEAIAPNVNDVLNTMDGLYIPEVIKPTVEPTVNNAESSNLQGFSQKGKPTFTVATSDTPVTASAKHPAKLIDPRTNTVTDSASVDALDQNNNVIGTYRIVPETGEVTFTPNISYKGTPQPVKISVPVVIAHDKDDVDITVTKEATYSPRVVPVEPFAEAATTRDVQGKSQVSRIVFNTEEGLNKTQTVNFNRGAQVSASGEHVELNTETLTLLDASGAETNTVTTDQGVYVLDKVGQTITFTPKKEFVGTATAVNVQIKDMNGTKVATTYTPTVIEVTPTGKDSATSGPQGLVQTSPIVFNQRDEEDGKTVNFDTGDARVVFKADSLTLVNGTEKVKSITVANVGTYELVDNAITFTPVPTYHGTAEGVTVQVEDENGKVVTKKYVPTVTELIVRPENKTSTNIQGEAQEGTPVFNIPTESNNARVTGHILVDPTDQTEKDSVTVAGKGIFTIDGNGKVTFTPLPTYKGDVDPITVKATVTITNAKNESATITKTATYKPIIVPAEIDKAPATSRNLQGLVQTGTPTFTPKTVEVGGVQKTITVQPNSYKLVKGETESESLPAYKAGTTVEIGTYTINPATGVVTFTPTDKTYTGAVEPVSVQATGSNGVKVQTTYTPEITPVTPTKEPSATTDVQGKKQVSTIVLDTVETGADKDKTINFNKGSEQGANGERVNLNPDTLTLLNDAGAEVSTLTTDDGEYVLDKTNRTITFTPKKTFVGPAKPVKVQIKDVNGTKVETTYTPTVTDVTITPKDKTSEGNLGKTQTGTPEFEVSSPDVHITGYKLLNPTGDTPIEGTEYEDPEQGTYRINPTTGQVTFIPKPGFQGEAKGIKVRATDENGETADAKYTPTVNPFVVVVIDKETKNIQGLPQEETPTFTLPEDASNATITSRKLVDPADPTKTPKDTVTLDGKGTFRIDGNGKVTFTPEPAYTGDVPSITVKATITVTNDKGESATIDSEAHYKPVIVPLELEKAPVTTRNLQGLEQKGTPTFTPKTIEVDGVPKTVSIEPGSYKLVKDNVEVAETTIPAYKKNTTEQIGTYTLNPSTGEVTFRPTDKTYTGEVEPVAVQVTGSNGVKVQATYTPEITPVTPTKEASETTDVQGKQQVSRIVLDTVETDADKAKTVNFNKGAEQVKLNPDTLTLLDASGSETNRVATDDGEYVLDKVSNTITFMPKKTFTGQAKPVRVQIKDANGTKVETTYTPTVTDVTMSSTDATSSALQGVTQTGRPSFTISSTEVSIAGYKLLNPTGNTPVDGNEVVVPNEGTYRIDPTTGEVTFVPNPGFTGPAAGISVQATDANGETASARYTPTVNPLKVTPKDKTSMNIQGEPQDGTPTFTLPTGVTNATVTSRKLVDPADKVEKDTVVLSGKGTFTINRNGKVVFTPEPNYADEVPEITVKATITVTNDDNDIAKITSEATYRPIIIPAELETAPAKTANVQGAEQTGRPEFTPHTEVVNGVEKTVSVQPNSYKLVKDGVEVEGRTTPAYKKNTQEVIGKYTINIETGEVTFTPTDKAFKGEVEPATVQATGSNGVKVKTSYTPTIIPVTPSATDASTTKVQGATQEGTVTFTPGKATIGSEQKSVPMDITAYKLLGGENGTTPLDKVPAMSEDGTKQVGTYTIKVVDGQPVVTFTPTDKAYAGKLKPVTVQGKDTNGSEATATYTPVITPIVPTSENGTSSGPQGVEQTGSVTFNPGKEPGTENTPVAIDKKTMTLLGTDGTTPVESLEVSKDGKVIGTYTLVKDPNGVPTGEVKFTPTDKSYVGEVPPATVQVKDANGTPAKATYTPTLTEVTPKAKASETTGIQGQPQTSRVVLNQKDETDNTTVNFDKGDEKVALVESSLKLVNGAGEKVTRVTVENEGTYELSNGAITFTPLPTFHGKASGVSVQVEDINGKVAKTTYTPTVTEVTPQGTNVGSEGIQGAPQSGTPTFTSGHESVTMTISESNPAKLVDPTTNQPIEGTEIDAKNAAGEKVGKYTIEPATGKVTFTPNPGFTGTPVPATVQAKNSNGTPATATYTPVVKAAVPSGNSQVSSGIQGAKQTATPVFTPGENTVNNQKVSVPFESTSKAKLIDPSKTGEAAEVTTLVVENQGTYTIDDNGVVTFTPLPTFKGEATEVSIVRKDKNGTPATAKYKPTVVGVTPSATEASTTKEQGAIQEAKVNFTPGKATIGTEEKTVPMDPNAYKLLGGDNGTTPSDTVPAMSEDGTKQVGTYTIKVVDGQPVVTFTPTDKTYAGKLKPVTVQGKDTNGTEATTTYTPTVTEVRPEGTNVGSEGIQGAPQSGTPTFTSGHENVTMVISGSNPAKLVVDGQPVADTTIPAKDAQGQQVGTYTIEPATGKVTFTPNPGFTGTPVPATVQAKNSNGTPATATYTPVVKAAVPSGDSQVSSGIQGAPQTATPVFTPGKNTVNGQDVSVPFEATSKAKLIDPSKTGEEAEVTRLVVENQGTYTIDDNGVVTFTPLPTFKGEATEVSIVRKDKNGTPATAKYKPTVVGVTPSATEASTTKVQGATQEVTVSFTPGKATIGTEEKTVPMDPNAYKLLGGQEGKTPLDTVPAMSEDGTKEVGTYTIKVVEGKPVVTFTPTDKTYAGKLKPVTVQGKDTNGTEATTTYTPVITPIVPTSENGTSSGPQGVEQTGRVTFNPGKEPGTENTPVAIDKSKMTLLGTDGTTPVESLEVSKDGKVIGTYTLVKDPNGVPTGEVKFTPTDKSYVGEVPPATVQVKDANGTPATATYTPTLTEVTPKAKASETTGVQGQPQTSRVVLNQKDETDNTTVNFDKGDEKVALVESSLKLVNGAGEKVTRVTVENEGTYELSNGAITFTPLPSFHGKASGVSVQVEDANGKVAKTTYTPTVTEVTPQGTNVGSEGIQGAPQSGTPTFTSGHESVTMTISETNPAKLVVDGQPVADTTIPAKNTEGQQVGTYTIEPATGKVTFTPNPGFTGTPVPATVQAKNSNGTPATATYTPVVKEAVPSGNSQVSSGIQGAPQTATPVFTPGKNTVNGQDVSVPFEATSKAKLIDPSKTGEEAEVTRLVVENQGTYTIDDNGVVTFTPLPTFKGEATEVSIVRKDKNGTPATAKYKPTVVGVTPSATVASTTKVQGATQEVTVSFTPGKATIGTAEKSVPMDPTAYKLLGGENGTTPLDTVPAMSEDGTKEVGTYTIKVVDGQPVVTFTPTDKTYAGKLKPVTVQGKDTNGSEATTTYTPVITPIVPTSENGTSSGPQGVEQTGRVTFNPGKEPGTENTPVAIDKSKMTLLGTDGTTPVESLEVSKDGKVIGTYTLVKDPNGVPTGEVKFTPTDKSYVGEVPPATVQVQDANGTPAKATYTPTLTKVTPTGKDTTSTGLQGKVQTGTPTFTPGTPEVPMDDESPATFEDGNITKTIDKVGTYTVAKDGTVTFTPDKDFVGEAPEVTVKRVDKNGTAVTAKYKPIVAKVLPTGEGSETEGAKGKPQTSAVVFDKKDEDKSTVNFNKGDETVGLNPSTLTLIDKNGNPSTEVKVPGEGTYTLANNVITFTPEKDFAGKATGVTVQVKDINGTPLEKTYTPTVRPVTTFVDPAGNLITVDKNNKPVEGEVDGSKQPTKDIYGYKFVRTETDNKGNTKHIYEQAEGKSVKVTYVSTAGETLSDSQTVETKDKFIGTDYDASIEALKLERIEKDGKVYLLKERKTDSATENGKLSDKEQTVTYVYEEVQEPASNQKYGNVVVVYKDKFGRPISGTTESGKEVASTVIDTPNSPLATKYDTTDHKPQTITTKDGKKYKLIKVLKSSDAEKSGVKARTSVITYVYESLDNTTEYPEAHIGVVLVNYLDEEGNPISGKTPEGKVVLNMVVDTEADLVGKDYDTTDHKVSTIIVENGDVYELLKVSEKSVEKGKLTEGATNVNYIYRKVVTKFVDESGKEIKSPEKGRTDKKDIPEYTFKETKKDASGNTVHVYAKKSTPTPEQSKVTIWTDENGNPIKVEEETKGHGTVSGYEFVRTTTDESGNTVHIFKKSTPTPEQSKLTIWADKNGNLIKVEKGTKEHGTVQRYEFVRTIVDDEGNTIHIYQKVSSTIPEIKDKDKLYVEGNPEIVHSTNKGSDSEDFVKTNPEQRINELPNTGTKENASLLGLGILGALSGFGLLGRKKKED